MTPHISSSILLLHQLEVGRNNDPLILHIHQRLCPYGIYQGTYVTYLLVLPRADWLWLQKSQ